MLMKYLVAVTTGPVYSCSPYSVFLLEYPGLVVYWWDHFERDGVLEGETQILVIPR